MRDPRARRARVLATLGAIAVLGAAVVVAWRLMLRDSSEPVAIGAAVSEYRSQADNIGPGLARDSRIPDPGVYVFRTKGSERLMDAPIGDAEHTYPAKSAIVVEGNECGFVERWLPLDARARETVLCETPRGLAISEVLETREFFGVDNVREIDCPPGAIIAPRAHRAEPAWTWRCSASGSASFSETSDSLLLSRERVRVGRHMVSALHVRDRLERTGEVDGVAIRDSWRRVGDGLLVRQKYREQSLVSTHVGDLRMRDGYELRLVSLNPRR